MSVKKPGSAKPVLRRVRDRNGGAPGGPGEGQDAAEGRHPLSRGRFRGVLTGPTPVSPARPPRNLWITTDGFRICTDGAL
jgi:hypothetical protein